MHRAAHLTATIVFSVVLAADQVWKYLAAPPAPAPTAGRMQAMSVGLTLAVVVGAMLLVLMASVARPGTIPGWMAGGLAGGATSILIDQVSVGASRAVFDLAGIGDPASLVLVAGLVAWAIRALRTSPRRATLSAAR